MILSWREGRLLVDGIPVEDLDPEQGAALQEALARALEALLPDEQTRASVAVFADRFADLSAGVDALLDSGDDGADPPAVARGQTVRGIRRAAAQAREERDGQPTKARTAEILHTSVATLDRAMNELGMEPWPPGPPDD